MNKVCSVQFNRQAISWPAPPPPPRVWGWASCRFFSFIVFFSLFACTLVSRVISFIYNVQVRGGGLDVSRDRSFCLCSWASFALPCCCRLNWVVSCTDTDYVYPAFDPLFADISCLLFLSFQKVGLLFFVCCSSFSFLFHQYVFFLFYWPFHTRLIACLIRAALLLLSFCLPLFISRCFVIGSSD